MGCVFSKEPETDNHPPPPPPPTSSNPQFTPDLTSYEAACLADPGLQTFDSILQQRTSRVITTLANGIDVRSLSLDSLQEVTECLLETNEEGVKLILDRKKDIWKNQQLFDLVEDYFDNSLKTLDFCTSLEKCLKRARNNQVIVGFALKKFELEHRQVIDGSCSENQVSYSETLKEFRNFKVAGDPFDDEFFTLFQSVYNQQMNMLEKLQLQKRKLDKKLNSVKSWRKVSNVIFVVTFVAVLICSVVAAAIAAPPVVTALAAAAAVPLGSMGKWINSIWNKYENEIKGQREIISLVDIKTYVVIKDLESISVLVDKLEGHIESMLQNAEFALGDEAAVIFAIDEIRNKHSVFMQTIEKLSERIAECSRHVTRARKTILNKIIKHPSSSR